MLDECSDKEEAALVLRLSQSFADSAKAQDMLRKLMETKVPKVWESLSDLIKKPRGNKDVEKVLDDLLKRLGPKNLLIDFVRQLVSRISDNFFGFDFVKMVLQAVAKDEDEVNNDMLEQIVSYSSKLNLCAEIGCST